MTAVDEKAPAETGVPARAHWWLTPARWWRELLIIGIGYGLYTIVQHHINVAPGPALAHADDFLALERHLGIDVERPLNHWLVAHPVLAGVSNYYYVVLHEVATPAVILWVFRARRAAYPYARFLLAVPTLIGFTLYYVLPVAPPRLLPAAHVVDTMTHFASPGSYSAGPMSHTAAEYAAFPSLHLGWALWCGVVVCWLCHRWYVRVLAVCYPMCTAFVVLATGNHYVVDLAGAVGVVGFGVVLLVLLRPAPVLTPVVDPATQSPG